MALAWKSQNIVFAFLTKRAETTAIKLLTGFIHPTKGSAQVAGEDVTADSMALRSAIGLLPDIPAFYEWMRERIPGIHRAHQLDAKTIKERIEDI